MKSIRNVTGNEVTGMKEMWGDVARLIGLRRLVGVSDVRSGLMKIWLVLLLVVGMVVAGRHAQAQANYGAIVGTVTDTTGADVPGAQVTLKNNGTNATQTTKAGAGGTYNFVNLNPGSYSVSVTHSGFKEVTKDQIDVTVGGNTRVDAALPVGDVSQSVTVQAASAPLQTDTSTLGGVVEGKQVLQSPLNGRNVNNLLDFVPGVIPGGGTSGNTMANGGSGTFQAGAQTQAIAYGNYQIGGGFSGQSLFYVDGVESNVPENNVNSLVPTQDAVQEFRVSTNDISPEFGGFAGGVIQISTKQGTNNFHGSIYEYFRNTVLDANDWFSNHSGLARPPLHQNQYGVNLGGPILKNKLFFFFSFERESLTSGSISTYTLPTTAELGGDFSALSTPIYNPATGVQYSCNGVLNVICPNLLNATALDILKLESPAPNVPNALTNNFVATAPIEGAQNQFNARVDFNPEKSDQVFARYTFWNPNNGDSDPLGTKTGAGGTGNTTTEAVLGDSHIFNPSTIADLRLSWLENYNYQFPLSEGFDQSSINSNYGALQSQQVGNEGILPGLSIQGYGVGAELSQLYWLNTVYSINGSITKVAGRHTIKIGGAGRQIEWTNFGNNQGITLSALPSFTAIASNPNSGNALASFLLGTPSSTSISEVATWRAFLHSYDFFAMDTWQTTNKLTLNAGVRWEQPGAYSEVNNLDTVLQPNAMCALADCMIANPVTGSSQTLMGNLAFVASPQYPSRREEALHWKLFSPRVGFDYRAGSNSVVRGGYGISYLPAEITADSPSNSPINSAATSLSNTPGTTTPTTTVTDPFPSGILLPSGRNPAGLIAVLGQSIASRIPVQAYGYAQQWNLGTEHAFGSRMTFTLAYAGAKGTHLTLSSGFTGTGIDLNQLPDQDDSIGGNPAAGTGLFTPEPTPFPAGSIPSGGQLAGPTVLEGYLLRPYPQYQSVTQTVPRYGDSTYNALQSTFVRQFHNGGILQVAYTWSKLLSDTDNTSSFEDGQGGLGIVQDYDNLKAEKSISMQDETNNMVINYGVGLPFGHGQMYLNNSNGVVNAIVGGWRVNGITTFHSGLPLALTAAANSLNTYFGAGTIRPNYVPGCKKSIGGSEQSRADEWFNTACFTQPADFTFGDERRVDSNLRSAGAANFDFSANKVFKVHGRLTGTFSLETFNLFNRSQFGYPNTGLGNGAAFGTVTSQANLPRTLQFALRFSY